MKDLTQGSVTKHLLHMLAFLAVSMLVQTLYLLADLYWVGHLGKEAIAAVGVAGNLTMIVLALTQMLGVGTTTLMSQAAGRKDQPHAEVVFNQSFIMSIVIALGLCVVGFILRPAYCDWLSADTATADLAKAYLAWFLPALLLQFPLVALGSALRATGIIKPAVGFQVLSVFLNIVLVYVIIRGFGPEAQAGFGIGARLMQALFLPVVALSFAVAPVVGQNFGGRRADRVRHSVYSSIGIASLMMFVLTLIAYLAPAALIGVFSRDPRVIAFGSDYLHIVSLNFVSAGIVFTTSSVFQGIGNTLPPLFSSMTRLILCCLPAVLIARTPGFEIRHVWYLSVGSVIVQMCVNLLLLRHELRRKLRFEEPETFIPASATAS